MPEWVRLRLLPPLLWAAKNNYTQGVIAPQAWIKETETELSDSKVLTLPGGFEPATLNRLAWPRTTYNRHYTFTASLILYTLRNAHNTKIQCRSIASHERANFEGPHKPSWRWVLPASPGLQPHKIIVRCRFALSHAKHANMLSQRSGNSSSAVATAATLMNGMII